MDNSPVLKVENVLLTRRGHHVRGSLTLSRFHLVFSCKLEADTQKPREIWLCYPIIERISKARGSFWCQTLNTDQESCDKLHSLFADFDKYAASHIRLICKDFTYYSFDFSNESTCSEVFANLSRFIMLPKMKESIRELYAFNYRPNSFEAKVKNLGWGLFDPEKEYKRQTLLEDDKQDSFWRMTKINEHYRFSSSYPETFITPTSVSDSVVQHAGKFRSKQRVPAVVYKHGRFGNGNIIARCSQPLVGLNFQNRSLQDEKLIEEIFESQRLERESSLHVNSEYRNQPQKNLILDLRPVTNAMAQHAMGAGTENIDNYRGKPVLERDDAKSFHVHKRGSQSVDKVFCNIENIHVVRDSLNKLTSVLSELEKKPRAEEPLANFKNRKIGAPSLHSALTKTQWLHHLFLILQAVDRITKSVHLNNTNVLIHCSDGWDRTSQVSALAQLCLDPYFRTIEGFMVLIEKEWLSFGFKFATRNDQSGCIGALLSNSKNESRHDRPDNNSEPRVSESPEKPTSGSYEESSPDDKVGINALLDGSAKNVVTSLFQRAASQIKKTAHGVKSVTNSDSGEDGFQSVYSGSNERSPVFHQFLDCVYQVHRQMPSKFEFNTRFLKRLLYHSYSCQYGSFLFDSEMDRRQFTDLERQTTSVWAYFLSRRGEFTNSLYDEKDDHDVLFFNYSEVKWWYELYGRSDEEMNGLSNSLEEKFARLNLQRRTNEQKEKN